MYSIRMVDAKSQDFTIRIPDNYTVWYSGLQYLDIYSAS